MKHNGSLKGAVAALQEAMEGGQPEYSPEAAVRLGTLCVEIGDMDSALMAFQLAVNSGHPDHATRAAVLLGIRLLECGDLDGGRAAFQRAIDSGHPDNGPAASVMLGVLLEKQGEPEGARVAYEAAVESNHPSYAPLAAVGLGILLERLGYADSARAAYQSAISSGHLHHAPFAELLLGEQLCADYVQERLGHRTNAARSGDPDILLGIAELYLGEGTVPEAVRLLKEAAMAGSVVAAYAMELVIGDVHAVEDDPARALLFSARSGDTDSMNILGLRAAAQGDYAQARSWWTQSAAHDDVIAPLLLARHSE